MTGANVYSVYAEGTHSYSAARKRRAAFEANVAANLNKTMPGDGVRRIALLRALGAAHVRVRHGVEARTSFSLGAKRFYIVLQAGLARRQPGALAPGAGPLAERVLARVDPEILQGLSGGERSRIAGAIDQAEITRPHPVDLRAVLPLPGLRGYLNFIAGRDKRSVGLTASNNRRAPANETLGFMLFIMIICGVTLLGAALVTSTLVNLIEIASDTESRNALGRMIGGLFSLPGSG